MRILTYCETEFDAQLIVGRLEQEGIMAAILNDSLPFTPPPRIRVIVNEEDYNQAIRIISVDS